MLSFQTKQVWHNQMVKSCQIVETNAHKEFVAKD